MELNLQRLPCDGSAVNMLIRRAPPSSAPNPRTLKEVVHGVYVGCPLYLGLRARFRLGPEERYQDGKSTAFDIGGGKAPGWWSRTFGNGPHSSINAPDR